MLMSQEAVNQHLRAPQQDGGTLIAPDIQQLGDLLAENRRRLAESDYDVQGQSLPKLATQARKELVIAAYNYTRTYRDISCPPSCERLFLAGHQPEIFHPGVWYKNFVLSALAKNHAATAINLVIDSDTIKSAAIRVPTGSVQRPQLEAVAIDKPTEEIPFEQRKILDRGMFGDFAERAARTLAPLVKQPLVEQYWPHVLQRAEFTDNLGLCLAQARHQMEGQWGATTLELPQSSVCCLPAFHRFSAHLLAHLPRLWDIYNAALIEFRRENHVRSTAHPAPQLASEGDWLEAPFWVWTDADPRRRRLFVRQHSDRLQLSDRGQLLLTLDVSADGELDLAAEQLAALASQGIKLRTRALITTMMARLMLGDLFLHGIGGAKYDQLTDRLIQNFFGLQPPSFLVASATLRLPIARPDVDASALRLNAQALRGLEFHPESYLQSTNGQAPAEWHTLARQKRQWIDTTADAGSAQTRCQAIRDSNARMQPLVAARKDELLTERDQLQRQIKADRVLRSREFAFCLYPEQQLRKLLTDDVLGESFAIDADGNAAADSQ